MLKRSRPVTEAELRARAKRKQLRREMKWLSGVQSMIRVWQGFMDAGEPHDLSAAPLPPRAAPTIWYRGQGMRVDMLLDQPEFQAATPLAQEDARSGDVRELDDLAPEHEVVDQHVH